MTKFGGVDCAVFTTIRFIEEPLLFILCGVSQTHLGNQFISFNVNLHMTSMEQNQTKESIEDSLQEVIQTVKELIAQVEKEMKHLAERR